MGRNRQQLNRVLKEKYSLQTDILASHSQIMVDVERRYHYLMDLASQIQSSIVIHEFGELLVNHQRNFNDAIDSQVQAFQNRLVFYHDYDVDNESNLNDVLNICGDELTEIIESEQKIFYQFNKNIHRMIIMIFVGICIENAYQEYNFDDLLPKLDRLSSYSRNKQLIVGLGRDLNLIQELVGCPRSFLLGKHKISLLPNVAGYAYKDYHFLVQSVIDEYRHAIRNNLLIKSLFYRFDILELKQKLYRIQRNQKKYYKNVSEYSHDVSRLKRLRRSHNPIAQMLGHLDNRKQLFRQQCKLGFEAIQLWSHRISDLFTKKRESGSDEIRRTKAGLDRFINYQEDRFAELRDTVVFINGQLGRAQSRQNPQGTHWRMGAEVEEVTQQTTTTTHRRGRFFASGGVARGFTSRPQSSHPFGTHSHGERGSSAHHSGVNRQSEVERPAPAGVRSIAVGSSSPGF